MQLGWAFAFTLCGLSAVQLTLAQKCVKSIKDYRSCMDQINQAGRSGSKNEIKEEETREKKRSDAIDKCFQQQKCKPPSKVDNAGTEQGAIQKCKEDAQKAHKATIEVCLKKADKRFTYEDAGVPGEDTKKASSNKSPSLVELRAALDVCVETSNDPEAGGKVRACIAASNKKRRKRQGPLGGILSSFGNLGDLGGLAKLFPGMGNLKDLAKGFDVNAIKGILNGGLDQELSDGDLNTLEDAYCTGVTKCKEKLSGCKEPVCQCFADGRNRRTEVSAQLKTCLTAATVKISDERLASLTDSVVRPSPSYCGLDGPADSCDADSGSSSGNSASNSGFGKSGGQTRRLFF